MATLQELRRAQELWQDHCRQIQSITASCLHTETDREKSRRIRRLQNDYAAFCQYYFPHFLNLRDRTTGEVIRTIPNAPFHNQAAKLIRSEPNLKAVFMWPRGHAKSTHMDIFVPLWLMFQPKRLISFMVVVGKSEDSAVRLLGDIQAELEANELLKADFGEQRTDAEWQSGEFKTKQGVKFLACGRGQSPRGLRDREARPDYIVIDDLDDDELCRNKRRVDELTQWVKEALFGALDVGRGRFIMVGNLIAKNSVLNNIAHTAGVRLSKIQAVDADGNPTWRDKWTKEEAALYRDFVGYRAWEKEMMHNPIVEGSVFRQEWIRWDRLPALSKFSAFVLYIDPSWKGSRKNDTKAAKLWGQCGDQLWCLRAFVRKASVAELVRWCYDLYEWAQKKGIAVHFYMEASFMQDLILDDFTTEGNLRGYQLPITGDRRKKPDKFQRVESISPLWERGFVFYDEQQRNDPDMEASMEQLLAFERGMSGNDDAPDADEGAIYLLQQLSRQEAFKPMLGRPRHRNNQW